MKFPSICGASSTAAVIVPQQNPAVVPRTPPNTPNNSSPAALSVIIKATSPEQAHLFRMIDIHGKCQDVELRMMNRIAMKQIEEQRREQILSTFLKGVCDEVD